MADWHLRELREALERNGWRFIAEHQGDDYRISASWEFKRETDEPPIFIDFDGLDEFETLPIDQSYGCRIRESKEISIYFGKKGSRDSSSRAKWKSDLNEFIKWVNRIRMEIISQDKSTK